MSELLKLKILYNIDMPKMRKLRVKIGKLISELTKEEIDHAIQRQNYSISDIHVNRIKTQGNRKKPYMEIAPLQKSIV